MQKILLSFAVVLVGSVAVAATLFLNQPPQPAQAALSLSCSTGFDRPLLFGIGHAFSPASLQTIPDTGGTFVTQGVAWDDAERTKGNVNEDYYKSFNLWNDRAPNVVVLGNVSGTPEWARDIPTLPTHKAQPRRNDPEVEARFRNFVNTLVSRNKDKVKYWSYWNEPNGCQSNHHTGSCAWDGSTVEAYVHWLNIFYEEVKKADSTAMVLGGELEMIKNVDDYVRAMNDRGARYDYLAVHPYDKEKEAAFPIGWVKSAYEAQRLQNGKRPEVFVTEWGWDGDWNGVDDTTISRRLAETFEIFKQNPWIIGAEYHAIRDVSGADYGLRSDDNQLRPRGTEFKRLSETICGTVSASGAGGGIVTPPPNKPILNGEVPITIRTHYTGTIANTVWPKVAVYLNDGAGYDGPYDFGKCDGSYQGAPGSNFCAQTPTHQNKRIDTFDALGSGHRDITVNASQLVQNLITTDVGTTKISYAFYNDVVVNGEDRNFNITKIEVFGPATDNSNQSKLLLTFTPENSDSFFGGYRPDNQAGQLANSFYFDLGSVELDNMNPGFDKNNIRTIKQVDSRAVKEWRLHEEGTFNVVSQEIQKVLRTIYNLNSVTGACVVASHDIGGDLLKRGQAITLTSVATVPINTFRYAFYNSDNRVNNIPQPYCVKGATKLPNDGCPAGSGQLVITSNQRRGAVQAVGWLKLPNGEVLESIWKGDVGWNRPLPFDETFGKQVSGVNWNFSSYLGIENYNNTFRSTAEIDAIDFYSATRTGAMELWRNNIGTRYYFSFNSEGNYPDWATAEITQIADLNKNPQALPGDGVITAAGSFVTGGKIWQIYWRGNQEWIRSVPYSGPVLPQFGPLDSQPNKGYTQGRSTSSLPLPNAKVQSINYITMQDGSVQEHLWQNDAYRSRTIPVSNGNPNFAGASPYTTPTSGGLPVSDQSTSATIQYNQVHQVDMRTGKIPENVQVNATFITSSGSTIGDHGSCVVRFGFDKSLDGDADGNCVNDIYDYNVLLENYGKSNCQYNLTGNDCTIDMADVEYLKQRFGQKCE